ncbi:hypothetical protein K2P97_08165 [bacterium]|nr:hypothetical protein [bacterium]
MSQDSSFLKNTLDLLETDPEVKSYIYQQIVDFNPFVTPETLVMVIARDPQTSYSEEVGIEDEEEFSDYEAEEQEAMSENYKFRIAIVLKDGEASIEAESFNNDVFEAIRLAKEKLVARLVEIQEEMENPKDRAKAIKEASDNTQVH